MPGLLDVQQRLGIRLIGDDARRKPDEPNEPKLAGQAVARQEIIETSQAMHRSFPMNSLFFEAAPHSTRILLPALPELVNIIDMTSEPAPADIAFYSSL